MKFLKSIEDELVRKYVPIYIYLFGLLSVLTTARRLTDATHEIQIIGSAWFRQGSIPIVQAYSSASPLMLYLGAQYDRIGSNVGMRVIFEIVIYSLIAYTLYSWLKLLYAKEAIRRNTLLLVGLLILLIPGVWQIGISSYKFGVLFLLAANYFLTLWIRSGRSYWFAGETNKNWRYLLLAGISLSALIYTSLLLALFAVPMIAKFIIYIIKNKNVVTSLALVLVPVLAQSWVWYSFFSSRRLLTEALRASLLDFRISAFPGSTSKSIIMALIPLAVFVVLAVYGAQSGNYKKDRVLWLTCVGLLGAVVISMYGGLMIMLPFMLILLAPVYRQKIRPGFVIVACLCGLALSIPYRYQDKKEVQLESAKLQVVSAYIEQRLTDTRMVYYYGNGAGFYDKSNLSGSTRFYNAELFTKDTNSLGLVDKFRGDNEANAPMFVIYNTGDQAVSPAIPRIDEYLTKHYEESTVLSGYRILKRK